MSPNTTFVALNNPSMQFPLIHMNGNSGKTLGNEYFDALRAFQAFSEKFFAVEFHKRDYYPLGDAAWDLAVKQRDEIKKKMSDIQHYIDAHAGHCFESAR
jgi:hypothetical protein